MRSRRLRPRPGSVAALLVHRVSSVAVAAARARRRPRAGTGSRSPSRSHQNGAMSGRFAPSPTGELHLGNLRTALVAWLAARSSGRDFLIRMEDLDRVTSSVEHEQRQLVDLAALGLDWDGDVVRQSERFDLYRAEIERLRSAGLVYECFCTRREIREEIEAAASAPHVHLPDGAYPGTCRDLTDDERRARREAGRRPALRLRTEGEMIAVLDGVHGEYVGAVDDVVLARADGVPAYNLAVVVDDIAQGVTQVVRGDDLLSSTPRVRCCCTGCSVRRAPDYLHVPLVLGADGQRLAKRHGAVTMADLAADGWSASDVLGALGRSLGLAAPGDVVSVDVLLERFDRRSTAVDRRPCSADRASRRDGRHDARSPRSGTTRPGKGLNVVMAENQGEIRANHPMCRPRARRRSVSLGSVMPYQERVPRRSSCRRRAPRVRLHVDREHRPDPGQGRADHDRAGDHDDRGRHAASDDHDAGHDGRADDHDRARSDHDDGPGQPDRRADRRPADRGRRSEQRRRHATAPRCASWSSASGSRRLTASTTSRPRRP